MIYLCFDDRLINLTMCCYINTGHVCSTCAYVCIVYLTLLCMYLEYTCFILDLKLHWSLQSPEFTLLWCVELKAVHPLKRIPLRYVHIISKTILMVKNISVHMYINAIAALFFYTNMCGIISVIPQNHVESVCYWLWLPFCIYLMATRTYFLFPFNSLATS